MGWADDEEASLKNVVMIVVANMKIVVPDKKMNHKEEFYVNEKKTESH